jgi:hypothetical protein
VAKAKTQAEKLHAAAVVRRSFELRGQEHAEGFRFVYQGVLRDLGVTDEEVRAYLVEHAEVVDEAIGRKGD